MLSLASVFRNIFSAVLTHQLWRRQMWAVLLSVWVGWGCAIALPSLAQSNDLAEGDTISTLTINIYEEGLDASFYVPNEEGMGWGNGLDKSAIKSAVMVAAGCDFVEQGVFVEEYVNVWGRCEAMPPVGWGWQGKVNLSPLLASLAQTPVSTLSLKINLPAVERTELTPPGEAPFDDVDGFGWANRLMLGHQTYDIEVASPDVTEIAYWYGFTREQVMLDVAGLLGVLMASIIAMLWLRQRALGAHAKAQAMDESVPIWFGYQRCTVWVETVSWFAWVTALNVSSVLSWQALLLPTGLNQHLLDALGMAITLLPAMLLVLVNRCLSFRVMTEVGQLSYSFAEVLLQYIAGQGVIICIAVMILASPFLFTGHWIGYVAIALSILGILLCLSIGKKLKDWTPYAITTGELRDRVFALAKPTGVNLKQLYLLPQKRSRMLNACAVKNDTVMVTDYLLKRLSKDEVDGIMAHEIAHLQLGHPQKLLWQLIIAGVLAMWATQLLFVFSSFLLPPGVIALQIPLALLLVSLFFFNTSRKFEYQADAQGVLLTGNPQAAITGLVKLTRFNQMPMQWGKLSESWTTHPSLQRRVSAIAKRYDIPDEDVDTLVTEALQAAPDETLEIPNGTLAPSLDRYDLDTAELSDEQRPLFSSEVQQKLSQRMLLVSVACFTLLPGLLGFVVQFLPTSGLRWIGYIAAALTTIAVYGYVRNVGPTWGFEDLRQKIAERLQEQGFDISQGTFVGFSPGAHIKVYEGCTEWDVGFLVVAKDRLCYVGERVKFAIAPHQITQTAITIESPEALPIGAVTLTWQADDLTSETYRFQPLSVGSVTQTKARAQQLHTTLENWQQSPAQEAHISETLCELAPPALGTVTSQPFSNFQVSNFLVLWFLQLFIGNLVATVLSASGPLRLFVVVIVTVGTILQNWGAIRRTIS